MLVVDDDALQLRALQRAFSSSAHVELRTADNAIDALLMVGAERPDLVVMDVFMPNVDGIEACRRIKANPAMREVQVVLTSAAMSRDLAEIAKSAGAVDALSKPFDVQALLAGNLVASDPVVEPLASTVRGADVLVGMLEEAGVEVLFGIPGGAISPVHDALLDSSIRVVTTRHESGAMFAAAAYARSTGKLGVVAVTSGPGVLNAMTGIASAWCDSDALLLLVGEVPRGAHGKGVLQDGSAHGLQIVEMTRHIAKLAVEVPSASSLPHLVRRAITTACSGRRGPVVMTLPLDITTAQIVTPRVAGSVAITSMIEPGAIDELVDLLGSAARPLILAGNGARGGSAPARLRAVAEKLGCPVATTPKGKGVFSEEHPLSLGVLGLGGHTSAREYLRRGVDVVLAIGTSLGDLSTDGFLPQLQATRALVHVDIDARQLGKSYAPSHAIVAAAAELLGALSDRLDERGFVKPAGRRGGIERHTLAAAAPGTLSPGDAIVEIQRALPEDTVFTVDSGEHFLFAIHYLHIALPDAFLVMTGLGSMGQSIGAAIGATLAHPGRTAAAICGDGCFAMNAFEIATAVAERLPIRVFVFNNEQLGMVEQGHEAVYGRRPQYPTTPLDVVTVARGLGAVTCRIDGPGQLAELTELLRTPGPVVVDVRIDPTLALPKRDRVAAMSPGSRPPKLVN